MKLVEDKKEITVENEENTNLRNEIVYGEERGLKHKISIIAGNFVAYSIFAFPIFHIIAILITNANAFELQAVGIIPSLELTIIYSIIIFSLATLTEVIDNYNFKELYILSDNKIIKTERRFPTEQHEIEWEIKKENVEDLKYEKENVKIITRKGLDYEDEVELPGEASTHIQDRLFNI